MAVCSPLFLGILQKYFYFSATSVHPWPWWAAFATLMSWFNPSSSHADGLQRHLRIIKRHSRIHLLFQVFPHHLRLQLLLAAMGFRGLYGLFSPMIIHAAPAVIHPGREESHLLAGVIIHADWLTFNSYSPAHSLSVPLSTERTQDDANHMLPDGLHASVDFPQQNLQFCVFINAKIQ